MRFQPHTSEDIRAMLDAIGVETLDDLFASVPEGLRHGVALDLPEALDEQRLMEHMQALASENTAERMRSSFLGGGVYEHFVPAVVDQILMRGEFLTAYTPYQPELAQGTLKAIFEFQTAMAEILGADLANASMYDGAHATAEALLMGLRIRRKAGRVLVSKAVHPEYREVAQTYLGHIPGVYEEVETLDGATDLASIDRAALGDVAMLLVQSPNFFGVIEDLEAAARFCKETGVLLGVAFSEPLAWGMLQPPGAFGADVIVGEGQSLGIAPGFGGPLLGIFACGQDYLRMTPGRLVSRTLDGEGRESYVLTLATREQHIRRARATSNICTNQGLMALAATIYLSLLGKEGFAELAAVNYARAEYAKSVVTTLPGVALAFGGATFNEFTLRLPKPAADVVAFAAERGIAAGIDLGRFDEGWSDLLLVAVTEIVDRAAIDEWASVLAEALAR